MSTRPARREPAAVGAITLATVLWGGTFVVIRDILGGIAPADLIALRFALAGFLLATLLALRRRLPSRGALAGGALSGLCAAGGYLFQAIGLRTTAAGSSAFLTCAGTLFAALFAWPLLRQRPGVSLLQGIALAAAGSALLAGRLLAFTPGEAWTLLGALVFALQIVVLARWAPREDPLALAAVQALTVALLVLPLAPHAAARLVALAPDARLRLAYLVLAGTVIAPLLQVFAQRTLPAGRVALLFALEPVFALLFAFTLGGERFVLRWWLGAALILAGVLRVEWPAAPAAPSPATR